MKGGMSGWREEDLESFEAEVERHELSPKGIKARARPALAGVTHF